jgi:transposase
MRFDGYSFWHGARTNNAPQFILWVICRTSYEAVKRGKKKIEVSRFFNISRNTLDLWLKQEKETGDYKPKEPITKGTRPKIEDLEKFGEFVAENSGKTQKEMAQLWGDNISQQNIS